MILVRFSFPVCRRNVNYTYAEPPELEGIPQKHVNAYSMCM